jgi:hypothetical protein
MPKPYPKEFRDDVVAVARQGHAPLTQIAKDFGISDGCFEVPPFCRHGFTRRVPLGGPHFSVQVI